MATLDEDSLSDASLIEDDDDDGGKMDTDDVGAGNEGDGDSDSESSFVIDLPGVPVTGSIDENDEDEEEEEPEVPLNKKSRPEVAHGGASPPKKPRSHALIDEPFFGFLPSEIPKRQVIIPDGVGDDLDLTAAFDMQLLDDGEDLTPDDLKAFVVDKPAVKRPSPPSIVVPMSTIMTSPKMSAATPEPVKPASGGQISLLASPSLKPGSRGSTPAKALPSPMVRESREWKPSAQFFKPLAAGWVREVIYDRDPVSGNYCDKPKEIVYYAPQLHGTKPRQFKVLAELGSYLASAVSEFTLNNFSFRKEPMHAPKGQEISRAVDEVVDIFPPKPIAESPAPRRKSVPAEQFHSQQQQQQQQQDSHSSKVTSSTSSGLLKVKIFSRMREKNINSGSQGSPVKEIDDVFLKNRKPAEKAEDDNIMLQGRTTPKTTIFEKSGMKLKISLPPGISAVPAAAPIPSTLSTPTVTITPAVKPSQSLLLDPKVSVTSTSAAQRSKINSNKLGGYTISSATSQPRRQSTGGKPPPPPHQQQSASKFRVLRPPRMSPVTCSIHCPQATNFPELSCVACHSLFHPKCVGLVDGVNYLDYEFYCYACTPPAGKENNEPPFKKTPQASGQVTGRHKSLGGGQDLPAPFSTAALPASTTVSVTSSAAGRLPASALPTGASPRPTASLLNLPSSKNKMRVKRPLRPLESQSVINIGGVKYLVVPQPQQQQRGSSASGASSKPSTPAPGSGGEERLTTLLKPAPPEAGGDKSSQDMPSYEVRETSSGTLILVPIPAGENATPFKNVFKQAVSDPMKKDSKFRLTGCGINSDVSNAYFALLNVFKYLNVAERLTASRVCKLWRDLALHPSLWQTLSLANIHVTDWDKFSGHVTRNQTTKIDFKKLLFPAGQEEAWTSGLTSVAPFLQNVTQFEFQKVSATAVENIVGRLTTNPYNKFTGFVAQDVACGSNKDTQVEHKPLNLAPFCNLKNLAKLKLRSVSGNLRLENLSQSLTNFVSNFSQSLRILSFLKTDSLTDEHLSLIGQFQNLDLLELGNCTHLSSYQSLSTLSKLTRLRLERGRIGDDVGAIENLENLELIDFELKIGFGEGFVKLKMLKKVLLIPTYKEEVARNNAEILDSASTLSNITHLFLGLTNEWLDASAAASQAAAAADSSIIPPKPGTIPILIKGNIEHLPLPKLSKTLVAALPNAKRVKVLKMSNKATQKQYLNNMKQ